MDVVGLLGAVQTKARADGTTPRLERMMYELATKMGLTQDDLDKVEDYAREVGGGAVVYYP